MGLRAVAPPSRRLSWRRLAAASLPDSQLRQVRHRPRQHSLLTPHHNRPLNQLRMRRHDLQQFTVTQIFPSDEFPIRILFRAEHIVRSKSRPAQQTLQLFRRQRVLDVIDALILHALFDQDTLDLAAGASGRLLVERDSGFLRHKYFPNRPSITKSSPQSSRNSFLLPASCIPQPPSQTAEPVRSLERVCLLGSIRRAASTPVP